VLERFAECTQVILSEQKNGSGFEVGSGHRSQQMARLVTGVGVLFSDTDDAEHGGLLLGRSVSDGTGEMLHKPDGVGRGKSGQIVRGDRFLLCSNTRQQVGGDVPEPRRQARIDERRATERGRQVQVRGQVAARQRGG
jgi:hypothetical protein